jgi:predicted RNA-binding protein YlqC (UPF0109 family)
MGWLIKYSGYIISNSFLSHIRIDSASVESRNHDDTISKAFIFSHRVMGKSKSPHRRQLESSLSVQVPSSGTLLKMGPNGMAGGHRPPDTDDKLLLSIASKQSTLVQQMITLTCYIPSSSVGAVIGRRGATIAQIQKQAQQVGTSNGAVRLSIVGHQNEIAAAAAAGALEDSTQQQPQPLSPHASSPEQSPVQTQTQNVASAPLQAAAAAASSSVPYTYTELDWSSPLWTPVVIRADPCATLTAAQLLREKVGRMDDVIMDIPLGRNKHSGLIGRRGFVLANLSADTNVRIMVPSRELRHDIVQLEGDLDNVKQCLERVLVITSDIPGSKKKAATANSTANVATSAARQQEKKEDDGVTETVTVSVLPPQAKLRTVGRRTDTSIKKKKVDGNHWEIIVHGPSAEGVKSAVATLHKWNEDNNSNNNITSSGTDKGEAAKNSGSATPSRPRGGRGRPQGRNQKAKDKNNNKPKAAKAGESSS